MSTATQRQHVEQTILSALRQIAPEIDPADIDPSLELRDQVDIDSMDFLNLVIGVHRELGIDIPEADYPQLATLDGFAGYLLARLPAM